MCMIILLITGIYLALGYYYKQGFMMNTWVNDVYCTGMNVEEVNKELLQSAEAPFLTIQDTHGNIYRIESESLEMEIDYTDSLKALFQQQKIFQWPSHVLNRTDVELVPSIHLDVERILAAVDELDFVKQEESIPKEVKIEKTQDGYVLISTLKNRLDKETMHAYIESVLKDEVVLKDGLETGNYHIDLSDADCYKDIAPDASQMAVSAQWQILEPYVHCGIIYDMGDEMIPIAGKTASDFLAVDESGEVLFDRDGQPKINEEAIKSFVNSLADAYNTWKGELTFISTVGEEKKIPYVNYGTEINIKKEIDYLTEAFLEKKKEIHIPEYRHEGYVRGKDDIGDTYIEVDMGNQKLYAYLKGELLVETDIVTGNVNRKMSTPEGVVHIYNKQRNRTLRGPGYASFVKYWMPVRGGIGLHDAGWRKEFGGEIYKTDGSHGCINIPRAVMSDIYENFEEGTPVIMFY